MKTRHFAVLLLIVAAGSACRVLKEKHRQQEIITSNQRLVWSAETELNTHTGLSQGARREDSLWQEYRVTIYPADSFRYDPLSGFSGRAAKVEWSGRMRSHSQQRDTLNVTQIEREKVNFNGSAVNGDRRIATVVEKTVKRSPIAVIAVGLVVLAAGAYWMARRSQKSSI